MGIIKRVLFAVPILICLFFMGAAEFTQSIIDMFDTTQELDLEPKE